MRYRIGDLVIDVTSPDARMPLAPDGPIALFRTEGEAPADIAIRAEYRDALPPCTGEVLFDSGSLWRLHRADPAEAEGGLTFTFASHVFGPTPYKRATFDRDLTRGEVLLDRTLLRAHPHVHPLEYPLDELLMTHLLARGRGVEIHGCGLVDASGAGYLFAGQSGAGKTTTARLWQGAGPVHVLSDDRIILRPKDDAIWMYGTPWHGEAELASPMRARLDRLFLLHQAKANATVRLSPALAAARLLSCAFVPFSDADALASTLATVNGVVQRVPCDVLDFVRDPSAVDFVRGLARPRAPAPGAARAV
jgi:hypothetical protein